MSECAFGFLDEVLEFAWGVAEELGLAVDVGGGRFQAGFLDEFVHEAEVEGAMRGGSIWAAWRSHSSMLLWPA